MTDDRSPEALRLLLPFYVNGTLDPALRAAVDAALAKSAELRTELAEVSALHNQLKRGGAAIGSGAAEDGAPDRRLSALLDRLPDQVAAPSPTAPPPPPPPPPRPGLSQALAFLTPRRWMPAISLSLLGVVGTMGVLLERSGQAVGVLQQQLAQAEEKYRSASGPCDKPAAAGRISLELKDGARWSDVSDLLDTEQLTIVDSGGLGTLTVASTANGPVLDALLTRLRASPLVFSADPAK